MDGPMPSSLVETLDRLEDPRVDRTKLHNLTDILVLSVLAVICGADSFVAIALFGQLNEAWLRTFLALPHGIPSHDTLGRVFARLDAARFEEGFRDWVQDTFALTNGPVVPIDGKSVRGSHDRGRGLGPLHLVSAWAQTNRLVLAQTAVEDDSNEITAIPELLRMLCLEGCIVTLDAMGCQKKIARQIRAQEADYVLRVRANHQGLHDRMEDTFALERAADFADCPPPRLCGHGREGPRAYRNPPLLDDGRPRLPRPCRSRPGVVRPGQPGLGRVRTPLRGPGRDRHPLFHFQPAPQGPAPVAGGATALEHRKRSSLGPGCRLWRGRQPHPHGLRRPQHGHPQAHRAQPSMLANSSLHRRPPVEAARA